MKGGGRNSLLEVSDRKMGGAYQEKRRSTGANHIAEDLREASIYIPGRTFP